MDKKVSEPEFWSDNQKAKNHMTKLNVMKKTVQLYDKLVSELDEADSLKKLFKEEKDEKALADIEANLSSLVKRISELEFQTKLSGELDRNNAIVAIHSGAGGTESCDWAEMLLRMYNRWAEKKGFGCEVIDILSGEEAGIKSVTLIIKGEFAYGLLQSEIGVHRLVRISPFDANKRRHTSFAAVIVYPEIEDDINIKIKPDDIRIDTFRASGAGGQHVNKTSSAVRITHMPSGIVISCQNERSQHKNKATALKILKSRLYNLSLSEQQSKMKEIVGDKKGIAWGNQIRSYVLQPYRLVKDHRTSVESGNVDAVLDGEINKFIRAFLEKRLKNP